ncbi:MAG: hypothetical protein QM571_00915 [Micrococcaceae bacterium]
MPKASDLAKKAPRFKGLGKNKSVGNAKRKNASQFRVLPDLKKPKRLLFPIICGLAIVATVGIVMALNIYIYQTQYQIVGLTNQKNDLALQTQKLNEDIARNEAPQNLAAKAKSLGMTIAGDPDYIDLDNNKIIGPAPLPEQANQPTEDRSYAEMKSIPKVGVDGSTDTASAAPSEDVPNYSQDDLNGGTVPAPKQKEPTASATAGGGK